jgi:hypothetical protein
MRDQPPARDGFEEKANARCHRRADVSRPALSLANLALALALALALTSGMATAASAATPIEKKILAADGAAGDQFGYSVAADGDTLVVGAPFDPAGTNVNQGSVYVFQRQAGGSNAWGQVAHLTTAGGSTDERFGESVAISGDVLVVGASRDNYCQGAAYVFERDAGGTNAWGQMARLTAPYGTYWEYFGWSVAARDDLILVGAFGRNAGQGAYQGAAYLYRRWTNGPPWQLEHELIAPDGEANDCFGSAVALNRNPNVDMIIGACGDDGRAGSAYLFSILGVQKLTASDPQSNALFGVSATAWDDVVVIGAQGAGLSPLANQGAAYVFHYQSSTFVWREAAKLRGSDILGDACFGCSAALRGDVLVVGARGGDAGAKTVRGAAYVFQRDIGGLDAWGQVQKLAASDGVTGNCFGRYVAIANHDLSAGAHRDAPGGAADRGSVYLYEGVPRLPDMVVRGTNGAVIASGEAPSTTKGTDFGTVTEGQTVVHTLSIANPGDYTLHLPSWSLTGVNTEVFQVSGLPKTVTAGAASNVTIRFFSPLPRTGSGTLAITNDAPPGPYLVNLSGSAVVGPRTARGTPYWWLDQFGWTDHEAADLLDPDGDGMPTWEEWVADTDPTSGASVLRILSLSASPPRALRFRSSVERLYSLRFAADLVGGLWWDVTGQTDVPGSGSYLALIDTNDAPACFYRIAVRVP